MKSIKKRFYVIHRQIVLLASLLVTTLLQAAAVDVETARQRAQAFVASRWPAARGTADGEQLLLAAVADSCYYIYNIGVDNGFVIVGGDDRMPNILGYADSGSYDASRVPAAVRFLLLGYEGELLTADTAMVATARARRMVTYARISPMLATSWDQGAPYNASCPTVGGTHAETGCVATAMAQVMAYHRWPAGTSLPVPGYTPTDNSGRATTPVMSTLPASTFNWDAMRNSYTSTADASEVARLMLYCGESVETWYRLKASGGSGAVPSRVPKALINYFGYDAGATYAQRKHYSYEQWETLVYTELAASRPVILGGNNAEGGHAFVCDGYENGFYHINWGWGGSYNGYFRLSLLDKRQPQAAEDATGEGFNLLGIACVGMQPKDRGPNTPAVLTPFLGLYSLSVTDISYRGSLVAGQQKDVYVTIKNNGKGDFHGDITLAQVWNGTIAYLGGTATDIPRGTERDIKIGITPPLVGTFELRVYDGYFNRGERVSSQTITVSATGTSTAAELAVTALTDNSNSSSMTLQDEKPVYGSSLKGKVTLSNSGTDIYALGITVALRQVTSWTSLSQFSVSTVQEKDYSETIFGGQSRTIDFDFPGLTYGERYLIEVTYYNYSGASLTPVKEHFGIYRMTRDAVVVDPGAVVADLRGEENLSAVKPNANPNCLYLLDADATVPSGLQGHNVVKGTTAAAIKLTDGYDFRTPIDFVASSVTYSRTFNEASSGRGSWQTIVLPFAVDRVTVDGHEIDWFRSSDDHDKQFWVKKLVADTKEGLVFDYADRMEANTPYVIAVPNGTWGNQTNLLGKTLVFHGTNTRVSSSEMTTAAQYYKLVGTTQQLSLSSVYGLGTSGYAFEWGQATVLPFRAYVATVKEKTGVTMLAIDGPGDLYPKYTVDLSLSDFAVNSDDSQFGLDDSQPDKLVFGNGINGRIRLTNSGSGVYAGGLTVSLAKADGLVDGEPVNYLATTTLTAVIGANASTTFDYEFTGLVYGERYVIDFAYTNYDGSQEQPVVERTGVYRLEPTIPVSFADGRVLQMVPTASTLSVPAAATGVDLRGCHVVTDVMPNANANCVYLVDDETTVPFGLSKSIVVNNGRVEQLTLADGSDFCPPMGFTATQAGMARTFTSGTNGRGGWTTLALPFDVDHVTIGGDNVDWFRSDDDPDGRFWVMRFATDSQGTVVTDYADRIAANTAYLVAVPDDTWGEEWNLTGKTIVFHGTNALIAAAATTIASSSSFMPVPVFWRLSQPSGYVLNAAGDAFERGVAEVSPFRAYLAASGTSAVSLPIVSDVTIATAIASLPSTTEQQPAIYSLDGRRIGSSRQLPKGIYLDAANGKKIIVK